MKISKEKVLNGISLFATIMIVILGTLNFREPNMVILEGIASMFLVIISTTVYKLKIVSNKKISILIVLAGILLVKFLIGIM